MIKELGNNRLEMYQGDTGTVTFKMTGDCEYGDTYVFIIKQTLNDTTPIVSKSFNCTEFTAIIDDEDTKLLPAGDYFWGVKLLRTCEDCNEIDTLIGRGNLKVKRGV